MASDLPIYFNSERTGGTGNLRQYSQQQAQVHLNTEELRILRECNRESFYYRCLPFAFTAMAGTYLAVQRGFLKPHPKYGSIFKQMGAGFLGWIVGKFSYRKACEEKFLHLQNSALADAIRKKRGYSSEMFRDSSAQNHDVKLSTDDEGSQFSSDKDYHSSYGALNLDTDKNVQYSDLDDRTAYDNEYNLGSSDNVAENKPRPTVTYDELRRKNREESVRQALSGPPSSFSSPSKWDSYSPAVKRDSKNEGTGSVNTYGDTWEK